MIGYYFYQENRPTHCAFFWSLAIAIKFFPGLLLIYLAVKKRYKLIGLTVCFIIIWFALPAMIWGVEIYHQYVEVVSYFKWYGDSWNGSLIGFVFRILLVSQEHLRNVGLAKGITLLCSCVFFVLYLNKLNHLEDTADRPLGFCLTLVAMLIFSPLGWIYYFPTLMLPIFMTFSYLDVNKAKLVTLWFLMFAAICFPIEYARVVEMTELWQRLSLYSLSFWSLCLLSYLLCNKELFDVKIVTNNNSLLLPAVVVSLISSAYFWLGLVARW
jgi:hypothetical protein